METQNHNHRLPALWALAFIAIFAACETPTGSPRHIHQWGEWEVTTAATCVTTGVKTRTCALNSAHIDKDATPVDLVNGHDVDASSWTRESEASETIDGKETGECRREGCTHTAVQRPLYATGTAGLHYELINDNTAYRVNRGTKAITDFTTLHIPAFHRPDGSTNYADYKPVTEIGNGTNTSASNTFGGTNATTGANTTLTTLTFADNSQLTTISAFAFQYCSNLGGKVTIPAGVTFNGTYAFRNCTAITSVDISSGVTISGNYTFQNCTAIASVNISSGATISGNYTFAGCSALAGTVTIPAGVTISGTYTFQNCTAITKVDISSGGNYTFAGCTGLTEATFSGGITSIASYMFNNCSNLTTVTIPASVTSIGASAFNACSKLTGITIPESVTSIGASAFASCTGLTSIEIPASVASIGASAFNSCSSLTDINVANSNQNFSSLNGILYDKEKTSLIKAPGAITGTVVINSSVMSIAQSAFAGCTSLTGVTFPTNIPLTEIGSSAFSGCTGLTSIVFPTSVKIISGTAFSGCTSLATVTFPPDIHLTEIGGSAFSRCTSLTSIAIPKNVMTISTTAFESCTNLTSVTFPADSLLITIGGQAFSNCTKVTEFIIPASATPGINVFNNWTGTQTIYVKGYSSWAASQSAWGNSWILSINNPPVPKFLQSDGTWKDKNGNATTGPQGT